ncbi:MAG: ATP-binding cassette domain-containing protein [Chitinophagaceae bacterium]
MKLALNDIKPLSFEYSQKENALWGKNITLECPQICKIVASSGSGKSTLISILSGLRSDYAGDIVFENKSTRTYSSTDWSKLRSTTISLVYQDLRLFRSLTVHQNLQLSEEISAIEHHEETIEALAEKMNIKDQLNKPVSKLSFGQMQRVAIIRSITRKFDWLILDEPFSHLDQQNASIAWELIVEQAKKRNAGIIIACLDPYEFISADIIFQL